MLLQRLLLNVIATFVTEMPLLRSLVATLVCLLFLLLHVTIRPMRHPGGRAAQTTFQASHGRLGSLLMSCGGCMCLDFIVRSLPSVTVSVRLLCQCVKVPSVVMLLSLIPEHEDRHVC